VVKTVTNSPATTAPTALSTSVASIYSMW